MSDCTSSDYATPTPYTYYRDEANYILRTTDNTRWECYEVKDGSWFITHKIWEHFEITAEEFFLEML